MAYTTIVTGTTITSSWANADVRDQTIVPFASTAARSAAITAPVTGQVSTLTTNTATEGIYQYTSAGEWDIPWNLPWGVLAVATVTANQLSIGTSATDLTGLTSGSLTLPANRRIMVTVQGRLRQRTSAGSPQLVIADGSNTQLAASYDLVSSADGYVTVHLCHVESSAAGAKTFKARALTNSNTVDFEAAATLPGILVVQDIGPSGVPA